MNSTVDNVISFPVRNIRRPQIQPCALRPDGTPIRPGDTVRLTGTNPPIGGMVMQLGGRLGAEQIQSYSVMCWDGICRPAIPTWIEYAGRN